ncbi:hypothetical protein [Agathobaculum sp.]|uniref:hypothetical protein n=1 Tax=Agathobaculum sp. TaxID=2048138 RepID=UPI0039A3D2BB
MQKRLGKLMQAAGALVLFLLACASDMGAVSVAGLAAGLACAAGLFLAGLGLARRRVGRRRVRCAHEGIPLTRMI